MEENKNYSEQPEDGRVPAEDEARAAEGEVTPAADDAAVADDAAADAADAEADAAPIAPEWRFGGEGDRAVKQENKKGTRAFIAVFAGVLAICILLLSVTFFLGDGTLRFIHTIYTDRTVYVREYTGEGGLLSAEEAADIIKRSTVVVTIRDARGYTAHGSGFLYSEDDDGTYICTNNHVVEGAVEIEVILADGTAYPATLVGTNADADVAVVRIAVVDLPLVTIGSSANLLTGEDVFAVGAPLSINYAGTVTFGKVSHPRRLLPVADATGASIAAKMTLIQTDTALNGGNSGGPLADMYGKVVGMVVSKVTSVRVDTDEESDVDGICFALPIDGVKVIADAIIQNGSFTGKNPIVEGASVLGLSGYGVSEGYWHTFDSASGVGHLSLTEQEGYEYAEKSGVYTVSVGGGLAGDKVFVGDIVLKVNGLSVHTTVELIRAVNRHYAGETVTLTLWRGGSEVTVNVTLTERPLS